MPPYYAAITAAAAAATLRYHEGAAYLFTPQPLPLAATALFMLAPLMPEAITPL